MWGEFVPDNFGVKHLDPESKEEVRKGTCIAMRCMEMAEWMISNHRSAWYETRRPKAGHPSVFKLPAALEIAERDIVNIVPFYHCGLGAETAKPTEFFVYEFDTAFLPPACDHPPGW